MWSVITALDTAECYSRDSELIRPLTITARAENRAADPSQICDLLDGFINLVRFFFSLPIFQGEKSFFLLPGESLQDGIQNMFILGEDEGLILRANEAFSDSSQEGEVSMMTFDYVHLLSLSRFLPWIIVFLSRLGFLAPRSLNYSLKYVDVEVY